MFGQKVRARSVKNTVDEVEDLVKQYGFECISFSDDTFSINKKRAIEICREIVKRRLNVKLRVQLRANTVWEDLIEEFKKAGCIHVDIGAESGSSKILETLKKGITVEQIKNAVSIIKNRKIKCGVTFIIGTLGEMYEDVELSKKLAIDLDADYTQFFIMTPYPGTPLYNIAKKNNLFSGEINFEDYRHGGFELKPILNVEISKKKLIELQDNLNKQFLGKIVRSYMLQPKFITDLLYLFTKKPLYLFIFIKAILRTRSLGKSLKIIMPHQI
jgi:anaerobic magnesium-protoporphyrin IX monomethyl ester cyclase